MILPRLILLSVVAVAILPSAESLLAAIASVEDRLSTYLMLAGASALLSELAPIFGGIASREGQLQIERVIVAVTVGGFAVTTALYFAGRLKWDWLRKRLPFTRSAGTVALRIVRRNPIRASFMVRYLFGGRILLPMACGAARVPLPVYLPISLLGSLAWTVTFALVGIAAGEAAEPLLAALKRAEGVVTVVIGVLLLVAMVWWWRRRKRRAARRGGRLH